MAYQVERALVVDEVKEGVPRERLGGHGVPQVLDWEGLAAVDA